MTREKILFFYRLCCSTCHLLLVACPLFLVPATAHANNLNISNVVMTAPNATNKTIQVQFDIAWANSWRNQTNYDAVWLFIKYSTDSGTTWNHAILKTAGTNPLGISRGTGTDLDILVSTTSLQLTWDYDANGLTASSTARVRVWG